MLWERGLGGAGQGGADLYNQGVERKLATVLFVDLVGSTEFVSTRDPEVVRRRVTSFFEHVSQCITLHGGIVEKFAGDAVMAAFGIPVSHEDDAERAVRAAEAMLESVHGLGLEARVGIESGEVVADESDSTFATGEAVNVAARLQQAAAPGEILLGPFAQRLTASSADTEERGTLGLKGFGDPLPVYKLTGVHDALGGRASSLSAAFIGRDFELELLNMTFARVTKDRRAHLFTIYGEPGVGKSRLVREFADGVEGATILGGRSLPYGEGITYWPLAEMVKVAAGIADDDPVQQAVEKLRACCGDDAVADLLGLAAGVLEAVETERSQQEIAWAAREWAAELADAQPLILVFEDIHWAEEPLLDLLELLAERVKDAPLLLVCLARPELLDLRPGWGGGRVRATAIELEPLDERDSEELLDALLADNELSADERRALLEKTEGNPLFVEETTRMLLEGGSAKRIPDTLQAMIAARIDRLPRNEKVVLQRASIIGRIFWEGGLTRLTPEIEELEPVLDDLLARDFLTRESRSTISGERAYRFKHVLIRDVAYAALTKGARAELHQQVAEWLAERVGDELLEIRAYHLDHATTLLEELDGTVSDELASAAAFALEMAGRRALAREANRPARRQLVRAAELEPTLKRRYLAAKAAGKLADFPALAAEMEAVFADAVAEGDTRLQGLSLVSLADVALLRDADLPRGRELVEQALVLLEEAKPEDRYEALSIRGRIGWWLGDLADDEHWVGRALEVAREVGRKDLEASATEELATIAIARLDLDRGQQLAADALELAEESGNINVIGWALTAQAKIDLLRGRLVEAAAGLDRAGELFSQSGHAWALARVHNARAWVEWKAGDLAAAERRFRDAIRILKPLEDRGTLCESQRGLAQVLVAKGKLEEAERYALEARRTVGPHDNTSRATTRVALGLVRAAQGRDDEAEALLREAADVLAGTEHPVTRREVIDALAQFLRSRGRHEDAEAYEAELEGYEPALAPEPA
jgi:class 3 adenylate cyclase/ATP/maltotriose-dependent transcriptional regulator MalT